MTQLHRAPWGVISHIAYDNLDLQLIFPCLIKIDVTSLIQLKLTVVSSFNIVSVIQAGRKLLCSGIWCWFALLSLSWYSQHDSQFALLFTPYLEQASYDTQTQDFVIRSGHLRSAEEDFTFSRMSYLPSD